MNNGEEKYIMNVQEKIIEYIRTNKVSTTEVADCLGKTGVLEGILPINKRKFCVGPIKWVYAYNESNWEVHEQIREVKKGEIVYIEAFNCKERAIVGDLVSKYLLLYCQAEALITNAKMRDAHQLIKENYSIWCTGVTPIGCFNKKNEEIFEKSIIEERKEKLDGAIAVCDDSGVVVIPKNKINEQFLESLIGIEEQEDIWFDCIDRRKWDTFDTVCLKKYLD